MTDNTLASSTALVSAIEDVAERLLDIAVELGRLAEVMRFMVHCFRLESIVADMELEGVRSQVRTRMGWNEKTHGELRDRQDFLEELTTLSNMTLEDLRSTSVELMTVGYELDSLVLRLD